VCVFGFFCGFMCVLVSVCGVVFWCCWWLFLFVVLVVVVLFFVCFVVEEEMQDSSWFRGHKFRDPAGDADPGAG